MDTLTTAPVAPLLDRLFGEAAAADPATDPAFAAIPRAEQLRLMRQHQVHFAGRGSRRQAAGCPYQ